MARARRASTTSSVTHSTALNHGTSAASAAAEEPAQEMSAMYDYLAKIILLGPSGSGKSCLLHRFVKGEWRVLSSQTIGVEFASKIVKVGATGGVGSGRGLRRARRVKLQLWDTAGTERFRSVSRSYYRGAAGAILVYDVGDARSFTQLSPFLSDVRMLGSRECAVVLAGNKRDLVEDEDEDVGARQADLLAEAGDTGELGTSVSSHSLRSGFGTQQRATRATGGGRAVSLAQAAAWATQNTIPAVMEVSALSGDGVDEVFNKLARTILTRIELGEIDPDDPMSGIQYGDADFYGYDDGTSSIKSTGLTSDGYGGGFARRRPRRTSAWGGVFRLGRTGSGGQGSGNCC